MSKPTIQEPVSPLRQRMLEDMAMRGLREHTQHDYIRFVRSFAAFLRRSPDTATAEDIRRFSGFSGRERGQPPTINCSVSALRFFFTVTLDRPDLSRRLVLVRHPRKLPDVLSADEVARLLEAAPGLKYKAALGTAYGAGLRVSEVAFLKVDDIDSIRMLIRVQQGKGRKDRNAMLSPQLLDLLRLWWREGKRRNLMPPHGWLFPGRSVAEPVSARQINRAVHEAAEAAGIRKRVSPHTLRHYVSFLTMSGGLSPHPPLRPARHRWAESQRRAGQEIAGRTRAERDRRTRPRAGLTATLSLLWWTYGRHRGLRTQRSATRTAVFVPAIRDDAVVTRPDQYRTPVEAKLLRLATRRALTPNSKRPDHWTVPQQTGLPSRTYPVDDPSAHDESSICTLPLCPQRIHDSPKILKTP